MAKIKLGRKVTRKRDGFVLRAPVYQLVCDHPDDYIARDSFGWYCDGCPVRWEKKSGALNRFYKTIGTTADTRFVYPVEKDNDD